MLVACKNENGWTAVVGGDVGDGRGAKGRGGAGGAGKDVGRGTLARARCQAVN